MEQNEDIEGKLRRLTPRQCQVMYWICRDYEVRDIAIALSFGEKAIEKDIGGIYKAFGWTSIKNIHQKRQLLKDTICPIHLNLVANPDFDCTDKVFQKGEPLPPDPETMRIVKSDLKQGLLPLNRELAVPGEKGVTVVNQNRGCNRTLAVLLALLGVFLLTFFVLILVVIQLAIHGSGSSGQIAGGTGPAPTATSTPIIPNQPRPTTSSGPTDGAPPVVPGGNPTLPPLSTPPTAPTATSTVCGPFQFSDDFQGDLKPELKVISGKSIIVNGRLGPAINSVNLEFQKELCDFTVEFDFWGVPRCCSSSGEIFLTIAGKLSYHFFQQGQYWDSLEKGNWANVAQQGGLPESGHYKLVKRGTDYSVFLNDQLTQPNFQINYDTPLQGPLQLTIIKNAQIDNLKITAP